MDESHGSSEAQMDAMDALHHHLARLEENGQKQEAGGPGRGFDDEVLRRYLASPDSAAHSTTVSHEDLHAHNFAKSFRKSPVNSLSSSASSGPPAQQSLESALAGLGDDTRQRLLNILQLAGSMPAVPNYPAADMLSRSSGPYLSQTYMPTPITVSSSSCSPSVISSGPRSHNYSRKDNSMGSPIYYSNAFQRYSGRLPNHSVNTTGSTESSVRPSPVLSAITNSTLPGQMPTDIDNTSQLESAPTALHNMHFALPESNYYRSPVIAPGTSSSAFYSDNGLGDDTDLLFTPLHSPALTASTQPGPSVGPLPETFANLVEPRSHKKHISSGSNGYSNPQFSVPQAANSVSTGSPLNLFSPLTSPALRPQFEQEFAAHDITSSASPHLANIASNVVAGSSSTSARSSSIRGASRNHVKSRPSPIIRAEGRSKPSKRSSVHNHSPTSNAYPTSPVYPLVATTRTQDPAQSALKNSPSPHEFDLTSATPATLLQNMHQRPQEYETTQEAMPRDTFSGGKQVGSAAEMPNSLDLNTIFGLLAAVDGYPTSSSALHQAYNHLPVNGSSAELDDMHLHPSQRNPNNIISSAYAFPGYPDFYQQAAPASGHESQLNATTVAPLTPASFMNLPPNQYNLLTGLLADQAPQSSQPQHPQMHQPSQSNHLNPNATLSSVTPALRQHQNDVQYRDVRSQQREAPIDTEERKRSAPTVFDEKEAKSANKIKGASRRQSQSLSKNGRSKDVASTSVNGTSTSNDKAIIWPNNATSSTADEPDASGEGVESNDALPNIAPDGRKSSHKHAEQRRRDSLKVCFEDLRCILPPINPEDDEDFAGKRPGENNVGGQRGKSHSIDPLHPNKGISKVALLRKSNEYISKLHNRVDKRDAALKVLREELRACRVALGQGVQGDDKGLDAMSSVDFDELDEDNDVLPPMYRATSIPGVTKSFRPLQPGIDEDDAQLAEEMPDPQELDAEEYRERKVKRSSNGACVSTRNSSKAISRT